MEKFSYIASLIATILGLCEPFGKKMKTILTLNFLGNLLVGASYHLTAGISGAAICYVACFQVLINYIFDAKGKKVPMWLIVFHAIVFHTPRFCVCVYFRAVPEDSSFWKELCRGRK